MSQLLTASSIAPWGKRVLALIDTCTDRTGSIDPAKVCERLAQTVRWPDSPRAQRLLSDAATMPYRRIALDDGTPRSYEALVIAWPPRHATPIHDHDGLWGLEFVLDGALQVDAFHVSENPAVALESMDSTVVGIGDHVLFTQAGYAHQCRNLSRNSVALSLHVYGGELNSYRSFHRELDRWLAQRHATVRETSDI